MFPAELCQLVLRDELCLGSVYLKVLNNEERRKSHTNSATFVSYTQQRQNRKAGCFLKTGRDFPTHTYTMLRSNFSIVNTCERLGVD